MIDWDPIAYRISWPLLQRSIQRAPTITLCEVLILTSEERHEKRYQRRKAKREQKRYEALAKYDDFNQVARVSSLIRAHFESRKGVMWKASVARYDSRLIRNSVLLHNELMSGKFKPKGFFPFVIYERGKRRQIHSVHYVERVLRRSVCMNALVPILSHNLIYDNGASLKDKGVSFSIKRCETHLHRFYRKYGDNKGYILIIDFKSYFDNIDHSYMKKVLREAISDERIIKLSESFIDAPNDDKSVTGRGKGLYIGPEDSQILAIAYPNAIDHKIKDEWRNAFYGKYMDDSYILFREKSDAIKTKDALFAEFEKVGIIPNKKKTQIIKLSRGFTYLKTKYYLTNTGRVIKKPDHDNVVRERRKLKKLKNIVDKGDMSLEQVVHSYMSWRGAILQRDAWNSVCSMDRLFYQLFKEKPWIKRKDVL